MATVYILKKWPATVTAANDILSKFSPSLKCMIPEGGGFSGDGWLGNHTIYTLVLAGGSQITIQKNEGRGVLTIPESCRVTSTPEDLKPFIDNVSGGARRRRRTRKHRRRSTRRRRHH